MLQLITATFSLVFLLQPAAKVQELCKNSQALSSALASLGRHSSGPSGSKFRRPLCFDV